MIEYRIDRRSGVATYLQIVQQTKQALRLGLLEPGDRLPTAREVVEATAINPNTVLKAYRELEREGLAEGRRGLGTFVRGTLGGGAADSPLRAELRAELTTWVERARTGGLERDDLSALFDSVLTELADRFTEPTGTGATTGTATSTTTSTTTKGEHS
ncbi:GntR family transcriptional regulator [Streptomyces sp. IB2014 016-6]|uniref:GntR family transcriptional regulator n=1 Tax=Streptomyces sp. IB2014 016-6 TaxID=2517818 RepID=UPI0011C99D23|nr:GntR family transcriptional regulator [Streptomyces sp. IB2014 016-6]TXL87137.1 GntR family transcriptional regulator [Streptomyces sp. IB2014 016-6]